MRLKLFPSAAALAAVLGVGFPSAAALAQEALSEQDVSVLAGTCANCHGTEGRSPGAIPPIAGLPFEHLHERLLAFRSGEAEDATVMGRHARGYTDEELEALARYFSEIEP